MQLPELLRVVGAAFGSVGGALLFVEFFQLPSYVTYDEEFEGYELDLAPGAVREHTWLGRIGGLGVSIGFALLFVAELL